MNSPAISTDAIFTSFRTRGDRSLGFSGVTPELSDDEMLPFMKLRNRNVKLIIQPKDEVPDVIVDIKGEFDEKSPSQRMRNSLYVLHQQLTASHKIAIPFEAFYLDQMSRLIQSIKDQLQPPAF